MGERSQAHMSLSRGSRSASSDESGGQPSPLRGRGEEGTSRWGLPSPNQHLHEKNAKQISTEEHPPPPNYLPSPPPKLPSSSKTRKV